MCGNTIIPELRPFFFVSTNHSIILSTITQGEGWRIPAAMRSGLNCWLRSLQGRKIMQLAGLLGSPQDPK